MNDVKKRAEKAGRFDSPFPNFDEISLRNDLRELENRLYEPPSSVVRRVAAELGWIMDYRSTSDFLRQIKDVYGNK